MRKQDMTIEQIEELIKQKVEIDNKQALENLRAKQREEMKALRAELTKKRRQEKSRQESEVGKYFIGKFNSNLTTKQYIDWVDKLCNCWGQRKRQSEVSSNPPLGEE